MNCSTGTSVLDLLQWHKDDLSAHGGPGGCVGFPGALAPGGSTLLGEIEIPKQALYTVSDSVALQFEAVLQSDVQAVIPVVSVGLEVLQHSPIATTVRQAIFVEAIVALTSTSVATVSLYTRLLKTGSESSGTMTIAFSPDSKYDFSVNLNLTTGSGFVVAARGVFALQGLA